MSLLKGITNVAKAVLKSPVAKFVPGLNVASTIYTAGSALNYGRKALGLGTKKALPTPMTAGMAPSPGGVLMPTRAAALPPLPGAGAVQTGRALVSRGVAAGRAALPRIGRAAAHAANLVIIGSIVYDLAGNPVGRTGSRRINPLNHRALRRAITRVKSARNICRAVENELPKRKAAASRSCAPRCK